MDPIDSDAALRALLGFLTLRPGDTDAKYFDSYTDAQRAFADGQAEELQEWGMDPKDSDYPDEAAAYYQFIDILDFDKMSDAETHVWLCHRGNENACEDGCSARADPVRRALYENVRGPS